MQKLNLHYLHINCTPLKSIEIEAQCLTELLVCLLSVSSSCLSDQRPNLAQLEKTHYLLLKCSLLSESLRSGGTGRGQRGPHVGTTDVRLKFFL